ncbi:hypothetical protein J6590_055666 [Homalodisca vitripennis]|nr:hypothetical protein J6590_055666 [Homalodisca vitripennis]
MIRLHHLICECLIVLFLKGNETGTGIVERDLIGVFVVVRIIRALKRNPGPLNISNYSCYQRNASFYVWYSLTSTFATSNFENIVAVRFEAFTTEC